jgi:hypothetical protein
MLKHIKRRKTQKTINQTMVLWIEDLDDMIVLLDHNLTELRKDLDDLIDFIEDNLD